MLISNIRLWLSPPLGNPPNLRRCYASQSSNGSFYVVPAHFTPRPDFTGQRRCNSQAKSEKIGEHASFDQESLLTIQASEREHRSELLDQANESVDFTRDFLESCAELDPLVPPSEKILALVPDNEKTKKGTNSL
jgi:hypothetical protein